jgi:nucleoside-diphosphate-sugar epimerase
MAAFRPGPKPSGQAARCVLFGEAMSAAHVLVPKPRAPIAAPKAARLEDPSAVLLTGVTGFVGAFLLHELLQVTRADVYCLVDGLDDDDVMRRIRHNLERHYLWCDDFEHRIIPLRGDPSRAFLGLDPESFEELAGVIDVVYHGKAQASFPSLRATPEAPKAGGTGELVRFATLRRHKPIHFVSTLSILASFGRPGVRRIDDTVPLAIRTSFTSAVWRAGTVTEDQDR